MLRKIDMTKRIDLTAAAAEALDALVDGANRELADPEAAKAFREARGHDLEPLTAESFIEGMIEERGLIVAGKLCVVPRTVLDDMQTGAFLQGRLAGYRKGVVDALIEQGMSREQAEQVLADADDKHVKGELPPKADILPLNPTGGRLH